MRNLLTKLLKTISLLLVTLTSLQVNAQNSFNLTLENDVQVSDRILEFDLYLLDTDAGPAFELAAVQAGIIVNSGIYNGGTITITIIPGSSQLVVSQQPSSVIWSLPQNTIKLTPTIPPPPGSGTIISKTGPGTRICRLRITNSVPFTTNSQANLTLNFTTSPYPTKVAQYISGIGTQLVCNSTNCFSNLSNIFLNPPLPPPTAFGVTGTGSYCQGAGGLPVGLTDSETSVTYTLFKDGVAQVPTVAGTGSAISFGNNFLGTHTYTASGTSTGGTTPMTGSAVITENAIPTITGTTPASRCGTGSVTLGAAASSGTINWYAASSGGSSLGTGTSFTTPSISSTTLYYVDATANGCTTASRTSVTATINIVPTITSTTPGSVCGTGTVTLGATASAGIINWYAALSGGSSLGTGTSFTTPSISSTTIYYVDATSGGCTTGTRTSVTATVNTIPTITGTTPGSRCGTGTVILGATASAGTINWYALSSGGSSLGSGTSFTTPSISSTTLYYVDATVNGCTTASRTSVTATVNVVPTITSTTPGSVCGTGTVTLGATASAGIINWYAASSGGSSLGTGTSFTTPVISTTTTYYVDATNNGCTTASRSAVVATVGTIVTPTLTGLSTVCAGSTGVVYTTETGQTNYIWNISAGGTITSGGTVTSNTATVTWNTAGAQSISVTYTPAGGCTANVTNLPVTVNTIPTITGTTSASRCGTGTVILGATASAGTINWYAGSTGGSSLGTGISFTTPSISSTTIYYVDATSGGCTTASRTPVTATVNIVPIITSTTPGSVCGTGTVTLGATTSIGTINWYAASTGGSSIGTGTSFTTPIISTTTTYYVDATNNGCTTASRSAVVATVGTILTPTLTGSTSVCAGTTGVVYTTETGQTNYIWSISAGGTITSGGTVSSHTATVTWNTAGVQSISVTYTPAGGCTANLTNLPVTVNATPTAPIVGTITQPTCAVATGSVVLSGLPTGTWTINPGAIPGSTVSTTISGLNAGTYNFTVTNSAGCISPASGNVIINTQPVTPVIPSQTGSTLSGAPFVVNPTGGVIPLGTTYTWTTPTYTNGVTGGSAQLIPQANINGTLTIPSGSGTATYTVTPTSGICIGAPFTLTETVASTCTAVTVGTQPVNSSMCATSGTATFTVVAAGTGPFTYQWQYYNSTTSTWDNVVNGTPAGATYTNATTAALGITGIITAGAYQYRCYITNCGGGNTATSNPATLTVLGLPVPTLTSSDADNIFCFGTSVTFTGGGGGVGATYDFRVNGATVQTGPSTTYTTTALGNAQIVTVVVTNASLCSATSAGIANFVNQPPFITSGPTATCSTDYQTYSVVLTVSTGLVTSTSGIVANSGGNNWTISGILAGVNITITVTGINGCLTTQPVTAPNCLCPVLLPPVSGGDRSYCAGGVIPALTATVLAGETIDWYNTSSGGSPLSPPQGTLSFTPTVAGTYYALARNTTSNCVSSTRTAIVLTMNPLPTPTLVSSDADNIFCSGTSVTFTATGGTSYNFFVGGISVQNGATATYTTTTLTNGQAVNVVVTNANGCIATAGPITNTVNPTPVPTLTSSDADNNFCLGTSVTFTASGGTNYNFRVDGVGVQNGSLTTYTTTSLTNGQVVDVIVSNTNGCTATSTGITNSVFESPIANAGTGGNNCGLAFHLNGSLTVGTGTWSKVSGSGSATFSPDANTADAIVTVTAYGSYTFGWTVANGTCSTSATVTVVFIQQPPANAGSGGDVCGKSFIMNAPVTTGLGTWAKISGLGNAVFTPDNHHPDATVTVDQFGSYNFEWTLVNSTCTSTGIIKVVFHDLPPINAGRDTALCKGSSVQLQAKGTGTIAWVPAARVSNPNIINPIATPDTTTKFTVNLTDQFGCKNSSDIVVEVRDKTIANAGPDQVLGYIFTTTMDAVLAHSYENGVWSVISGKGDFVDSTNAKTTVKSLSPGENKFLWTVTNGYCPLSHDTTMISVIEFIIPTLITPNGDGRNDYFVLRGLATLGRTELIIFDRRGAQVYKNLNYDNSWNGLDYNKNPLPDDTYFYVIKSANGKSISGYIVIRR